MSFEGRGDISDEVIGEFAKVNVEAPGDIDSLFPVALLLLEVVPCILGKLGDVQAFDACFDCVKACLEGVFVHIFTFEVEFLTGRNVEIEVLESV